SGREPHDLEGEGVGVGEPLPVDFGLDELADEIVSRVLAAFGDAFREVGAQRVRRRDPSVPVDDHADELEGPALELCSVAFGQAEDPGDDAYGKCERQSADEVGTTERSERVDELGEDSSDELVRPAGAESGAERGG